MKQPGNEYTEHSLVEALKYRIVHFAYRKKSGEEREAYGTLNPEILDLYNQPSTTTKFKVGNAPVAAGVVRYFDTMSDGTGAFRSFLMDNLLWVETED